MPTGEPETPQSNALEPLESAFRERLLSIKSVTERRTLAGLARELSRLPLDVGRTALEMSASIAGVSIRASIEFLRAVPTAARILQATEIKAWGEMGRRLTMSDVETGVGFFVAGVEELAAIPSEARPLVFQICSRQVTLSSSASLETFSCIPIISNAVQDPELLRGILEVASEISRRSARHSADFLAAATNVSDSWKNFPSSDRAVIAHATITLASAFAARAGGIAADAWTAIPQVLRSLTVDESLKLLRRCGDFLERGGGVALHVLSAGAEVQRSVPESFDAWSDFLWTMAEHGNASLVAVIRSSPAFFKAMVQHAGRKRAIELSWRVIAVTREIAKIDAEAALACFRSSTRALRTVAVEQFEEWARAGLADDIPDARSRRSYYALETRRSNEALHESEGQGLPLERVQHLLRLYIEALTGRAVEVAPLAAFIDEARIGDGHIIYLPSIVAEFDDDEKDFRLYKVLAAHAAGQIEFNTHERDTPGLRAAYAALSELYSPQNVEALDAFALSGYINDPSKGEAALSLEEERRRALAERKSLPPSSDYRAVLALFPLKSLARRIFGTLENGRIDRRLRGMYRGLRRDLDLTRDHLRARRPRIVELPVNLVPFELLFQITLFGGALDDSRQFYGPVVSELETIVADYLSSPDSTVADTIMATSRVYSLFQSTTQDEPQLQSESSADESESEQSTGEQESRQPSERPQGEPQQHDARELFNAWNLDEPLGDPDDLHGGERWTSMETPEQGLEEGEVAYNYHEWDRELTDMRVSWCRVIEKNVKSGDRSFVESTREKYKGIISSIRHQFQMLKPESLQRVPNELDGDDYDLDAVIDYVIDRRADGQQSERLYTKRLRRRRDVAVSFLLDQSSSTARTIGRHPLQPYTHPGRRIIEIEKEGLVLMAEALESVGDIYSINGFTSEGRRNVKFYVVKDFDERYTDEVEQRIGGITYQNNTRLGAAVRHAASRLSGQQARTRLLIVLSDGRPYDHDYGDARYARDDTREALREAKLQGIIPFCITIDRESEAELRDLYGDVGYTIIDDVLNLPERLPGIYRRLTT
jgi:nitric oxide reductase NorD protein